MNKSRPRYAQLSLWTLICALFGVTPVKGFDEKQVIERQSSEVLVIQLAPDRFAFSPLDGGIMLEGRFADSTISTGGGIIPFLFGSLIDAVIENKREQQRKEQSLRRQKYDEDARQILNKYSVEDPITAVKARVLSNLAGLLGLEEIRVIQETVTRNEDFLEFFKLKFPTALMIEFGTSAWGISQLPAGEWAVYYSAQARISKLQSGQVLIAARCREKSSKVSNLEQVMENDAALLKEKLVEAANICTDEMLDDLKKDAASRAGASMRPFPWK